ncbi:hypothetical protein N7457_001916 [Penicillium paradoxum]|uniref:uncharacterized protein n=1 Tax=Penicillium paradoxum TaxID=176176 RepID=UPI0025490F2F|nr:uncharacterized protein N7457_001916 [Penicillium paradoxum]KAJ5795317.1 hypothetical protein N7457_001916 [Penicillium paradoxum]
MTGIEAAGLALAVIPLLVNQLDSYALGIEKIKILRRYRREFRGYSLGLETQRAVLLNTLENALEDIVDDEEDISRLISNPQGEEWTDVNLRTRLRSKLSRNYDVFLKNMTALSELLEDLSQRLRIGGNGKSASPDTWDLWKFRKVLCKAVYDDLLAKVDAANTTLKLLVDQIDHREARKKGGQPWSPLLQRYQRTRMHAERLLRTIVEGNYWRCSCIEQHCVQLQLQTNPLENAKDHYHTTSQSHLRMVFSNKMATPSSENTDCLWSCANVVFKPSQVQEVKGAITASVQVQNRSRVRFDNSTLIEEPLDINLEPPSLPPIQDFCSSLHNHETHIGLQETIGFICNQLDSSSRFTMYAVKSLPEEVLQKPLREVLSGISRRDRLHIAAGLACGVIQFCGNWLKASWDSSDIYLAAGEDGSSVLMENLYLSWPILAPGTRRENCDFARYPGVRNNLLLPLGLALVELSLGKDLSTFFAPEDEHQDPLVTRFRAASRLVTHVYLQSGAHYADAVHSCLHWPGVSSLCNEDGFTESVFEGIVSPILKDFVNFEGLA